MPEQEYFSTEHDTYLFLAAENPARAIAANEHVLHEIRFRDIKHVHDSEEIDSSADKKIFTGKPKDMVRKGAIAKPEAYTVDAYNK